MQQQETIAELKAQIRDLQLKNEKLSAAAESRPIQDEDTIVEKLQALQPKPLPGDAQ